MKLFSSILFVLFSFCVQAQDLITLTNNTQLEGEVISINNKSLSINLSVGIREINYFDIQLVEMTNPLKFKDKINSNALIRSKVNFRKPVSKLDSMRKATIMAADYIPTRGYEANVPNNLRDLYTYQAGNNFLASGVCVFTGSAMIISTAIFNKQMNDDVKLFLFGGAGVLSIVGTACILSGGVKLRKAALVNGTRLTYRVNPTGASLALKF